MTALHKQGIDSIRQLRTLKAAQVTVWLGLPALAAEALLKAAHEVPSVPETTT